MKINFVVPIDPRPMTRPRFSRGRVFTPKEITDYKSEIKKVAVQETKGNTPLEGALRCSLKFFRRFKSTSRRFGDADNLSKAVWDALNKIIYIDDSQIVESHVAKFQSEVPRVEIEIETID